MDAHEPAIASAGDSETKMICDIAFGNFTDEAGPLPTEEEFYLQDFAQADNNNHKNEPSPLGQDDEETYISFYKQLVAFIYCTTGLDTKEALAFFPSGAEPTEQQFERIHAAIDEINVKLVNGAGANTIGLGVKAVAQMMNTYNWPEYQKEHPEFDFKNKQGRIEFYRSEFEKNPITVLQILHEITPALNLHAIFSDCVYSGPFAYFNELRPRLRKHMIIKIAILAEMIFSGMIQKELLGIDGGTPYNIEWCQKNVQSCFANDDLTAHLHGSVEPGDWPVKEAIKLYVGDRENWYRTPCLDAAALRTNAMKSARRKRKHPRSIDLDGEPPIKSRRMTRARGSPDAVVDAPAAPSVSSHLEPNERTMVERAYQENPFLTFGEKKAKAEELGINIYPFRKWWDEHNTRPAKESTLTKAVSARKKEILDLPKEEQDEAKATFLSALRDGTFQLEEE